MAARFIYVTKDLFNFDFFLIEIKVMTLLNSNGEKVRENREIVLNVKMIMQTLLTFCFP